MKFSSGYGINNLRSSFSQIAVVIMSSKNIGEVMEEKSIKIPENSGYKILKSLFCRWLISRRIVFALSPSFLSRITHGWI